MSKINSMRDHMNDLSYESQKRLSRFPAQVENDKDYMVKMTGTPPRRMRYTLRASAGKGIGVKVPYYDPQAFKVRVNGELVPENGWDDSI